MIAFGVLSNFLALNIILPEGNKLLDFIFCSEKCNP